MSAGREPARCAGSLARRVSLKKRASDKVTYATFSRVAPVEFRGTGRWSGGRIAKMNLIVEALEEIHVDEKREVGSLW